MKTVDFIIIGIIAIAVILVIVTILRAKKRGRHMSCSCCNGACSMCKKNKVLKNT